MDSTEFYKQVEYMLHILGQMMRMLITVKSTYKARFYSSTGSDLLDSAEFCKPVEYQIHIFGLVIRIAVTINSHV